MSVETEPESIPFEYPLLLGLLLTIIYGFTAYLLDLLDLEHVLFDDNLSPFASIFFTFVFRFTLSGILWLLLFPIALYLMKGISSRDFVGSIRLHPNRISTRSCGG